MSAERGSKQYGPVSGDFLGDNLESNALPIGRVIKRELKLCQAFHHVTSDHSDSIGLME